MANPGLRFDGRINMLDWLLVLMLRITIVRSLFFIKLYLQTNWISSGFLAVQQMRFFALGFLGR